ncbi:MAG: hypothetical protein RRB18_08975 [Sulfolobaceae archaeon]|nr:hypothetical protein [Sulfolobaceae archaeon]
MEVGYGYFLCTYCDYENDRDVIAIMNLNWRGQRCSRLFLK